MFFIFHSLETVMKKIILFLLAITTLSLTSCVKQKNCDCGLSGQFIYYDPPAEVLYCGGDTPMNAVFITGDSCYSVSHFILGNVPKNFRTKDTLNVSVCLKKEARNGCLTFGITAVCKTTSPT